MSFSVGEQLLGTRPAVVLTGPDGAACTVVPEVGSQLASLRLVAAAGVDAVEVLWCPEGADIGRLGFSGLAPILFPFPGRIFGSRFDHGGRSYRIPAAGRHAIHGFVGQASWRLVETGADAHGAFATTTIERGLLDLPDEAYPGDFTLSVTHRLTTAGYRHEIHVRSTGDAALPFGYGWHPYFRAPVGGQGSRAECAIRVPAEARWELTADLVPTGRRYAVGGPYDLREWTALGEKSYDDPFTMLLRDGEGRGIAELADRHAGVRLTVAADPVFQHLVVYAPRTMPAVCLEPYTCVPDAFHLSERGVPSGLIELDPGAEWRAAIAVAADRVGS